MITGFTIEKLDVQRNDIDEKSKIKIHNNLQIIDVEEQKLPFKDKKVALKFKFDYSVTYEPKLGNINMQGHILYLGDNTDEIIKYYKKEKKIKNATIGINVLNAISNKCNVKALGLSQDVNLPLPINLPKLKFETSAANYVG